MAACPERRRARNHVRRALTVLATLAVILFAAPGQDSASQSFTNPLKAILNGLINEYSQAA
jgi:hypothetical protein